MGEIVNQQFPNTPWFATQAIAGFRLLLNYITETAHSNLTVQINALRSIR